MESRKERTVFVGLTNERIGFLLEGQMHANASTPPLRGRSGYRCPFIGRLHQTRPATGHNATAHPTQFLSQVANRAKHPVFAWNAGRSENRDAELRPFLRRSRVRLLTTSHSPCTDCPRIWITCV